MVVRRYTILGCGSSPGVPRIGNDWGACDPQNPKNARLRCSFMVEQISDAGTTRILVDTSPDFRAQMLAHSVSHLDGVVYTHPHADHLHGIDDLRGFWLKQRRLIDIYADDHTDKRLREGFGYCFKTPEGSDYPPILNRHEIEAFKPFAIDGPGGSVEIFPYKQIHGNIHSLGFRFGTIAYSSDVSALPDETWQYLTNLDVWIVDALRYTAHPSHFSVEDALQAAERVGPKRTILTHMHIDLDYNKLAGELPVGVEPAYDGLSFDVIK